MVKITDNINLIRWMIKMLKKKLGKDLNDKLKEKFSIVEPFLDWLEKESKDIEDSYRDLISHWLGDEIKSDLVEGILHLFPGGDKAADGLEKLKREYYKKLREGLQKFTEDVDDLLDSLLAFMINCNIDKMKETIEKIKKRVEEEKKKIEEWKKDRGE